MVLALSMGGGLRIWNIYLVSFIVGFMNAFQGPASVVAMGGIVPKDKIRQASGMNSFSGNLVTVLSPVLAAALFALGGLPLVLLIDLSSFVFALLVLLFVLKIPETAAEKTERKSALSGCREGMGYLRGHSDILYIIITMALLNFFSRLTYENILSPMILERSGNSSSALGMVNAAMGIGGIVGGIMVSSGKIKADSGKLIYISAAVSFCMGDLLMGVWRNVPAWIVAGVAASLPIAFINAGQNLCGQECIAIFDDPGRDSAGRIFGGLCVWALHAHGHGTGKIIADRCGKRSRQRHGGDVSVYGRSGGAVQSGVIQKAERLMCRGAAPSQSVRL